MSSYPLPIETFIVKRMDQLGLRSAQVAERCGIRNIRTGLRALGNVYRGLWENEWARAILRNLAAALEVEESLVAAEVCRTKETIAHAKRKAEAEQEAAWRAAFVAHAYRTTETTQPAQIALCAVTGGPDRWLRIALDLTQPPLSYANQALVVARGTKEVPFFGAVTGVTVNYTPDRAVRFDLDGTPIECLPRAYSPGRTSFMLRGRRAPSSFTIY
jgi:hypothetical protein